MSLSTNIKRFRRAKGISQEYMAESLHIHQSVYCRLEKNETACAERLTRIAEILATTPDVLRTYHLTDAFNPVPATPETEPSVETQLIEKDEIIECQAAEITFLRRQVAYLQAIWHQYCGGGAVAKPVNA